MRHADQPIASQPHAQPDLSPVQVQTLVERFCTGSPQCTVLRRAEGRVVCRIPLDAQSTVVLKLWAKYGRKAVIRQITRTGGLDREVRILRHLHRVGVQVPTVLGFSRLSLPHLPYTDAIVLEDLGSTTVALEYVKRLLRQGLIDEAREFEDAIIDLTVSLLRARVVDPDHGMVNIVVTDNGTPLRLDFEIARKVLSPYLVPHLFGEMIGRLVGSFAFAVQPDVARANSFARRLVRSVRPARNILRRARSQAERMLEKQRLEIGIDTRLDLSW